MKLLSTAALLVLLIYGACFAEPRLKFETATFDPVSGIPQIGIFANKSEIGPDGKGYYIVQFQGPIVDEWKAAVESAGVELLDYIPDFAFSARAGEASALKLKELSFIRWVGDYAPDFRLSKRLAKEGRVDTIIRLYPGADANHISQKISEAGGNLDKPITEPVRVIRASIPAQALSKAAQTAGVAWIEPWIEPKLCNNVARGIMNVGNIWTDTGLYGAGQIVAIADTGLDNGVNDSTLSADFRGRLLKAYALAVRHPSSWSDLHGHGTHVSGSVLGNGSLSGSNPATHSYNGSFAGVAPEASLVFQSIADKNGLLIGIPDNLNDLFDPPYQDGARLHSNSWGSPVSGAYTTDSQNTDLFSWNHKDMVIVIAAGNDGVDINPSNGFIDPDSICSPATAKNCITVGASESLMNGGLTGTYNNYWAPDFPTNPIANDHLSNNIIGMAAFSSRGPTDDSRIKPDICAPGTNIISCRSYVGASTLWGVYNSNYLYSGGTSMSTPLVAGACVLVREFYTDKGMSPSAALIKATILNGAFDMTPGQYASPQEIPARPNNVEGWGRLDLKKSLIPGSPTLIHSYDTSPGLSTHGSTDYSFYAASSSVPLRVTLVWTDYPGSSGASTKLVNDLDLTITGPGGTVYYGNGTIDRRNNVEGIDIIAPATGLYTINIYAYNIPYGPQPYALVISGATTLMQPSIPGTVAAAKNMPDGTVVTLAGKTVTAGSDKFNNYFYIQENDRSSGIRVQYGTGGGPIVTTGSTVTVTGTLATVEGERVIKDPIVIM